MDRHLAAPKRSARRRGTCGSKPTPEQKQVVADYGWAKEWVTYDDQAAATLALAAAVERNHQPEGDTHDE